MPQAIPITITPAPISRQVVEAQIDLLIDLLDTLDGDPDLEPSLGSTDVQDRYGETQDGLNFIANANGGDDREYDDEREPDVDREPSLGWTDSVKQAGLAWAGHPADQDDREVAVGAARKQRPPTKTGGDVYRGCRVLGHPPAKPPRNPMVLRVRPKGRAGR